MCDKCPEAGQVKVLFVSGFVVDTFSEIERSYVELAAGSGSCVQYLWLVPNISYRYNRFARKENRDKLKEPVWALHLRREGVPYVLGDVKKYNILSNYFLFRKVFIKYDIDAVYTHFGYERYWAAFFAKIMGKAVIWNEHWHSLDRRFRTFKRWFYRIFVDEFISVSDFIAGTLDHMGPVHTLPNAIMPIKKRILDESDIQDRRKVMSISTNGKVVLMVAAFRKEKRHELALEICRKVVKKQDDVEFIFLGRGTGHQQFLEKVRRLKLEKNVRAPGHVDNVEDYYDIADVSILTSYKEPFGYVVLEAMGHGLPVVAYNSGGPAEVINNGETGILVADGDVETFAAQLTKLLRDKSQRRKMGENARLSVVKNFNRIQWIGNLNTILEKAVRTKEQQKVTNRQ